MKKVITFFSLFGSMGTLLCCALPVTLVAIGMGATFASLTSSFPGIIWITERKEMLFFITALMLALSYVLIEKSKKLACPIDPKQKDVCGTTKSYTSKMFWISVVIFMIGLGFSYILPLFL